MLEILQMRFGTFDGACSSVLGYRDYYVDQFWFTLPIIVMRMLGASIACFVLYKDALTRIGVCTKGKIIPDPGNEALAEISTATSEVNVLSANLSKRSQEW